MLAVMLVSYRSCCVHVLGQVIYQSQVVGLDFAQEMLDDAEARQSAKLDSIQSQRARIEWVQGDAMKLPFPDATFDAATMGYGLRNVSDALQAFKVSLL